MEHADLSLHWLRRFLLPCPLGCGRALCLVQLHLAELGRLHLRFLPLFSQPFSFHFELSLGLLLGFPLDVTEALQLCEFLVLDSPEMLSLLSLGFSFLLLFGCKLLEPLLLLL